MTLFGFVQFSIAFNRFLWLCVALYGSLKLSVALRGSPVLQYGQPSMTYDIASVVTLPGNGFYDEVITGNITGNYQW